jgi:hypothetical protein
MKITVRLKKNIKYQRRWVANKLIYHKWETFDLNEADYKLMCESPIIDIKKKPKVEPFKDTQGGSDQKIKEKKK